MFAKWMAFIGSRAAGIGATGVVRMLSGTERGAVCGPING